MAKIRIDINNQFIRRAQRKECSDTGENLYVGTAATCLGVTCEKTLAYAIESLPGHFGKANEPFY